MSELEFEVIIGDLPTDGKPTAYFHHPAVVYHERYEHLHGTPLKLGKGSRASATLLEFFQKLVEGRSFPLRFWAPDVSELDKALAVALFTNRDLVMQPAMTSLVLHCELLRRLGLAGFAHMDRDMARFFGLLQAYLQTGNRKEQATNLQTVVQWVRDYAFEGRFPNLPPEGELPTILDVGTNGFVQATTTGGLREGWVELFRAGHLRGVLFGSEKQGRREVIIMAKSPYLEFDLDQAAIILSEAELSLGGSEWRSEGNYVLSPRQGTQLPMGSIMKVLVRI